MRPWRAFLVAVITVGSAVTLRSTAILAASSGNESSSGLKGKLLYSRLIDRTWQIWQTDLETGERKQITSSPGDKRYPAWSPDGRVTYHTSNHQCYLVETEKGDAQPLLADLWPLRDLVWSPDGSRVAFSKLQTDLVDNAHLWVSNPVGPERLMLTQDIGLQYSPAWSPDGKHLAYVGGHGYKTSELYLINTDGSGRIQLTRNETRDLLPTWSPDGSRIAFAADGTGDSEIWVVRADGKEVKQLTRSPGLDTRPAWSPNGAHIAFTSNRSGKLEIWVMDSNGSDQRPLEQAEGGVCDPAWR